MRAVPTNVRTGAQLVLLQRGFQRRYWSRLPKPNDTHCLTHVNYGGQQNGDTPVGHYAVQLATYQHTRQRMDWGVKDGAEMRRSLAISALKHTSAGAFKTSYVYTDNLNPNAALTHVPFSHSWSFLKSLLAATVVIAFKSSCSQETRKHRAHKRQPSHARGLRSSWNVGPATYVR